MNNNYENLKEDAFELYTKNKEQYITLEEFHQIVLSLGYDFSED